MTDHFSRKISSVVIAIAASLYMPCNSKAEVTGNLDRLVDASIAISSNAEAILTWIGNAEVTDHRRQQDQLSIESMARVQFAYDSVNDKIRWNYDAYGSSITPAQLTYVSSEMWRDGEAIQFGPNYVADRDKRWNAYIGAERQLPEVLTNDYDPMFFTKVTRDETLSVFLLKLYKEWTEDKEIRARVFCSLKNDGQGRFIVDFREPDFFNTYVFDPKFDYSLVSFTAGGGAVEETWEVKYDKRAGVSVPSSWSYVNATVNEGIAETRFSRHVVLKDQKVNETLPADAFSLEAMGVRAGDLVSDTVRGGQYVVGEDWKLNDLVSGLKVGSQIDAPKKTSSFFLFANIVLVVLLSIWILFKHYSKQTSKAA